MDWLYVIILRILWIKFEIGLGLFFCCVEWFYSVKCLRPYHAEHTSSRPFSTWMGDRLGIAGAVGAPFLLFFCCFPPILLGALILGAKLLY